MECPSQQQLQDQLKARCTAAKRNFTLKNVLAMETCLDTVFDFIKKAAKVFIKKFDPLGPATE